MPTILVSQLSLRLVLLAPAGRQYARPVADVAAGGWMTQAGATTDLYAVLDETTADDADALRAPLSPATADEVKLRLAPLVDPGANDGHVLRYRYGKHLAGGDAIALTVTLYRADGTTAIASTSHTDLAETPLAGTLTLSGAEADAIPSADYATGLVVGFSAVLLSAADQWDFSVVANSGHLLTAGII